MTRTWACLVLLVMLFATGCAGRSHGPSEEWRLRNLEEKFLEFKELQHEQTERIAILESSLNRLSADFRASLPLVPEAAAPEIYDVSPETKKALAMYLDMFEAAEKDKAAKPVESEIKAEPEKAQTAPEGERGWQDYPKVGDMKMYEAAKTEPKPAAKPAPAGTAKDYQRGLALVQSGKPAQGRAVLEKFAAGSPKHDLVPNALYWIGESYYNEERFDQSILAFKEVYRRYPKHPKAAAALLKTAFSYRKLGDLKNARFYLTVLLDDFPDSEPAPLARKAMAEIGS